MLAAAIGIASVVATISITSGANDVLRKSITNLGTNIIVVQNKGGIQNRIRKSSKALTLVANVPGVRALFRKGPLNSRDVTELRTLFSKEDILVSPAVITSMNASPDADAKGERTTVIATDEKHFRMLAVPPIAGRLMDPGEVASGRKICVLDEASVYRLFSPDTRPEDVIGRTLVLSGKKRKISVEVVGVLDDPFPLRLKAKLKLDVATIARSVYYTRLEYKNVYLPFPLLHDASSPQINSVFVMPREIEDVEPVEERVKEYMKARNRNVTIWNQKKWVFSTVGLVEHLTSFSSYIWIMILGVAMVMIVTITLVSVRERYYEIAIRITEGATKGKITLQFAIESLYLSIVGGIVGIGLGYLIIAVLEKRVLRWEAQVSLRIVAFAFLMSVVLGILTSIPTAKRAASLNPVDVFRMH
jgi:putative ABC transport system permease protein